MLKGTKSWNLSSIGAFTEASHEMYLQVQKSKFKNAVFGLIPSYLILTTMFEPKNVDTSTFRPQKLTMSKRGFHLDVWNMANLLCKMEVLRNPKSVFPIISPRCHQLWDGLLYYIFHLTLVIGTGKSRNPPFLASENAYFSSNLLNKLLR